MAQFLERITAADAGADPASERGRLFEDFVEFRAQEAGVPAFRVREQIEQELQEGRKVFQLVLADRRIIEWHDHDLPGLPPMPQAENPFA